ncbi:MFS transporter [Gluconobacter cadivus]|uniref:MFS transporter n=1 Tax=Gluconobacter cadivus TaxID=2728101 RepID=UPI002E2C8556|nr:MFS transporter [Gluconobacter cadivus]
MTSDHTLFRVAVRRIIPLLVVCYMFSYLDRINLSFARAAMEQDLHFSDATFGLGAGLFFVGYIVFQVPSALLLEKFGPRRTIAAIMIAWSLISFLFVIISTAWEFCALRVLLGAAEAGFYPAVLYYLAIWFPDSIRARVTTGFLIAIPLSGAIGGPVSTYLLGAFDQVLSVPAWKWMILIEAIPPLLLGLTVLKRLDDGPASASWLDAPTKQAILTRLPDQNISTNDTTSVFAALKQPEVLLLVVICFCQAVCNYGIVFWVPTFIEQVIAPAPGQLGFYTAIPFAVAAMAMLLNARSSDRHNERCWHLAAPFLTVALCLVLTFLFQAHGAIALVFLTIALAAALCVTAMIFTVTPHVLEKRTLATGLAWINSLGAIGGLVGPYGIGWMREHLHSPLSGVFLVAACATLGAITTVYTLSSSPARRTA